MHILFICHGNICRSPMAEFILRDHLSRADLTDITVDSVAATREELGHDMYPPAKKMLLEKNIPFTPRAARLLTMDDYEKANAIYIMDEENRRHTYRLTGGDPKRKIKKLLTLIGTNRDVSDPWYTGDFETTYLDITAACEEIIKRLRKT